MKAKTFAVLTGRPSMITRNAMLAMGLVAAPAMAGPTATVTPIDGTMGNFFDNGQIHGHSFNFAPGGGAGGGPPFNLYDNIPTFLGGTSDVGWFTPFSIYGTFVFADWKAPSAQWGGRIGWRSRIAQVQRDLQRRDRPDGGG